MWETLLFLLLLGGAGLRLGFKQSSKPPRAWQDAAVSCGLQVMEASGRNLKARAGLMDVRIEACGDSREKGQSTRVMVLIPGPLDFTNVRIRPEPPSPWGREIEVGDASFDSTFFIEGPAPLVFALLDAEMRRLLLGLNAESRLEIFIGALRADMSEKKLPALLPRLVDIGQRLARSMDIPRRLAENAKADPEAGVRLHNLLLLIRELPGEPETVAALRAACSDPSLEIRLQAAKELGAEGHEVLFRLAESLVDDEVSAEAVSALDRELPFERARALLARAVSNGYRVRTARACLEALGRSGAAAAVDALAKVMDQEEGELAVAAAEALGATGSPAAEPPLIRALRREPADLRVAAASSLGRVGSAPAVLPLKEAAERSWLDLELRRAARQAIAEIQSRLQGASPGQLSLAGAEAGQLSLAADPAGQLSLSGAEPELTPEPRRPE